ncbi:MAG: M23 family metallopeptidase [Rhodospirillales bacterium]|nr:M23 family metallopeptidase [Rhodospirillales bacterium]
MTRRNGVVRRLIGAGSALVILSSAACAYIEVSPPPPKPAAKKALARTKIAPNPPRPQPQSRPTAVAERAPLWTSEPIEPVTEARGEAAEPGVHVVSSGETLYSISRRYNVDAFTLADHNDLPAPFSIYSGQRLAIPPAGDQPPRPAPSSLEEAEEGPMVASLPAMAQPLPSPPDQSERGFIWPVDGKVVSTFGPKARGRRNDGINIATARGAPVRAVDNGVVAYAGNELRGFGNMVLIKHQGGWISTYAHNDRLLVGRGDRVRRGQVIARAGSTGRADGVQLHFELRKGTTPVDPLQHLPRARP